MTTTLYRRNANRTITQWEITLAGSSVRRMWGVIGGKMQVTTHKCRMIQRKSPYSVASEMYDREIQKKRDAGFVTSPEGVRAKNTIKTSDITFLSLPKSFAPQKPVQEPPVNLVMESSRYIIQRKRDGQRHFALVMPNGKVRLYSRTMHDMTQHMPLLVRELEDLQLPPCSVLDGEIICDRRGKDDFRATNEVCRAGAARAQFAERKLPIRFMVFDYLFRDGQPLWTCSYEERYRMIDEDVFEGTRVTLPEYHDNFGRACRLVKREGWEGLVLWDRQAPCVLRMDGKPERNGCYKWKPVQTGDFVATGWLPGNGRLAKTVGKLVIAEWRYAEGETKLREICRVGTGFDNKTRDAAMRWKYPCVVEVKYAFQQTDTRALREPVFLRARPDLKVRSLQ